MSEIVQRDGSAFRRATGARSCQMPDVENRERRDAELQIGIVTSAPEAPSGALPARGHDKCLTSKTEKGGTPNFRSGAHEWKLLIVSLVSFPSRGSRVWRSPAAPLPLPGSWPAPGRSSACGLPASRALRMCMLLYCCVSVVVVLFWPCSAWAKEST